MSVKKKVNALIDSFIDKGADVKSSKDTSFKNVLIRVPMNMLNQLDESVGKTPWLTRTQWIVDAINEKLKCELREEES